MWTFLYGLSHLSHTKQQSWHCSALLYNTHCLQCYSSKTFPVAFSYQYNTKDININSFFHNFNGRLCNINSFFIYFTTQSVKAPSQYFKKEDRILCLTGTVPHSGYSCVQSTVCVRARLGCALAGGTKGSLVGAVHLGWCFAGFFPANS
jgi:hypothetical protein